MLSIGAVLNLFGSPFHWVRGFSTGHSGIDLSAPEGTPIRAVRAGEVTYAKNASTDPNAGSSHAIGGGNVVNVDVGGYVTQYAHMSKLNVHEGDAVTVGQIIGYVGHTGHATGPHLHFGVLQKASGALIPTNPLAWLAKPAEGEGDGDTGGGSPSQLPVGCMPVILVVVALAKLLLG